MKALKSWKEIQAEHAQQIDSAAREYLTKADRACYLYYSRGRLSVMADDESTEGLKLATGERMRCADHNAARLFIEKAAARLPYLAE